MSHYLLPCHVYLDRQPPPSPLPSSGQLPSIDKVLSVKSQNITARKNRNQALEEILQNLKLNQDQEKKLKLKLESETNVQEQTVHVTVTDFEILAIIGRGGFGEVRLVRKIDTREIFAMKIMRKADMKNMKQENHIRAERDVLALIDNPFVVQLAFSFQDDKHLYLVMEYLQGGDLMELLIKYDVLTEEQTRFYIAETAMAIKSVHDLNYVHRDLKPDNILLDRLGHVKLSDFGLCASYITKEDSASYVPDINEIRKTDIVIDINRSKSATNSQPMHRSRDLLKSAVGTPDYTAPEVISRVGYDQRCDWWSLGVIMYECCIGRPPFFAKDAKITCRNILNWAKHLNFPDTSNISAEAEDLIKNLICDAEHRLSWEGIKNHSFFSGIDWDNLRTQPAAIIPTIDNETDTQNFPKIEPEPEISNQYHSTDTFKGYTFIQPKYKKSVTSFDSLFGIFIHIISF